MLNQLRDILDFRVLMMGDNPITIGKLLSALIVLIIGLLATKIFFKHFGKRFIAGVHLKKNTSTAIVKVSTYLTYVLIVLLALRLINVPLTAFAFLGGAIAIGVGFGAQNIINNFISGFILMAERPINIGDLIDLDGVLGEIEEIGARCTRVRTGENIHILVPNSALLEKNITNWTLSDQQLRTKVIVGVIYGSPIDRVKELLLKAVSENDRVHTSPTPFVVFADFGDNALIFEVYFWISIKRIIERRVIESSVRFRIDEIFREAGIVIAFPQRDVHLDASTPLEFRIVDQEKSL